MEVVSTSNLVSSENKTACNFQTLIINSFVMPHDVMRGQIGSYAYIQTRNFKKPSNKLICIKKTTVKSKPTSNNLFSFENAFF